MTWKVKANEGYVSATTFEVNETYIIPASNDNVFLKYIILDQIQDNPERFKDHVNNLNMYARTAMGVRLLCSSLPADAPNCPALSVITDPEGHFNGCFGEKNEFQTIFFKNRGYDHISQTWTVTCIGKWTNEINSPSTILDTMEKYHEEEGVKRNKRGAIWPVKMLPSHM